MCGSIQKGTRQMHLTVKTNLSGMLNWHACMQAGRQTTYTQLGYLHAITHSTYIESPITYI